MSSEVISLLGIIIALAVLIVLSYRGVSLPIVAILSSAIILIIEYFLVPGSEGPMVQLKETFMTGFVGFTKGYFLLLLFSTIFAQVMSDSGAAQAIANSMVKFARKFPGKEAVLSILSLAAITTVLTAGGVSIFVVVFVLMPIAKNMFQELDISWHLFVCYALGSSCMTLGGLPGMPSITNIIPTEYLGTNTMAGVGLGIIGSVLMALFGTLYIIYAVKKAKRAGETFLPTGEGIAAVQLQEMEFPQKVNVWLALLPPVAVLVVLNVLKQSVEVSMLVGIILCYILFFKNVGTPSDLFMKTVGKATASVAPVVISTSCIVGFGAIASSTLGYGLAIQSMINLNISPVWKVIIAVNVCAGLLGSSSGGLRVALENLSGEFLASGLNPEVIHRISAVASSGLDSLPHASAIVVGLHALKLTHRQAYKHLFFITVVNPIVSVCIMALFAMAGVV